MHVELLIKNYRCTSGLARYATSLSKGLAEIDVDYSTIEPALPRLARYATRPLNRLGYDLSEFLGTYPVTAAFGSDSVKHLTTQQMGTLLFLGRNLAPSVITVHDILPYLLRRDPELSSYGHPVERIFDRFAMMGLRKADAIIAVSEYTRKTLIETLSIPADKISVIPNGVDHEIFAPVTVTDSFRARFALSKDHRYILCVGSAAVRKNLPRLLRAFAMLKRRLPDVKLVKIGADACLQGLKDMKAFARDLSLDGDILYYTHPSDTDLATFCSAVDLLVFPSLYEGFGLPPLEAMACGTPVVCSNTTSLPEVVGDAALTVDPYDVEGLAEAMFRAMTDANLRANLRLRGLARAQRFSWERTARATATIYRRLCGLVK